jgi:deoxyribodipyrimidine photolyase-related protein
MVLSNLATLLGISGRDLTDWFWAAYIDAFDWVVEPNVLAMGTFATGPVMTTKPYVSGAAYISRMSDYCTHCAFDPKRTCPVTRLYWDFLSRQADVLADNPRMRIVLNSLKKRAPEQKVRDRVVADWAISGLTNGSRLSPDELPSDGA